MLPTTFQNIEKSLKQLPNSLQIEVLHYIEFLKSNYVKQINSKPQSLDQASIETLEDRKVKKRDGFGFGKVKSQCPKILMRQWKNLRSICKYECTVRYTYIHLVY